MFELDVKWAEPFSSNDRKSAEFGSKDYKLAECGSRRASRSVSIQNYGFMVWFNSEL